MTRLQFVADPLAAGDTGGPAHRPSDAEALDAAPLSATVVRAGDLRAMTLTPVELPR